MTPPGILEEKDGIVTKISVDNKEYSVGQHIDDYYGDIIELIYTVRWMCRFSFYPDGLYDLPELPPPSQQDRSVSQPGQEDPEDRIPKGILSFKDQVGDIWRQNEYEYGTWVGNHLRNKSTIWKWEDERGQEWQIGDTVKWGGLSYQITEIRATTQLGVLIFINNEKGGNAYYNLTNLKPKSQPSQPGECPCNGWCKGVNDKQPEGGCTQSQPPLPEQGKEESSYPEKWENLDDIVNMIKVQVSTDNTDNPIYRIANPDEVKKEVLRLRKNSYMLGREEERALKSRPSEGWSEPSEEEIKIYTQKEVDYFTNAFKKEYIHKDEYNKILEALNKQTAITEEWIKEYQLIKEQTKTGGEN